MSKTGLPILRYMAERAVCLLASEMAAIGDIPANWKVIDRIERRWKMIGCADAQIASIRRKMK